MRKSKGEKIELLYAKPQKDTKKKTAQNRKKKNLDDNKKNTTINLDNEIIIGMTTSKREENKKNLKKNNKKVKPKAKKSANTNRNKKVTKKKNINIEKRRKRNKIVKWTTLILLLLAAIILFLLSYVFNTKEILVINNNKTTKEQIINLSGIIKNENMFKINKSLAIKNIKQNSYIEDVKIKIKLDGTVQIEVTERQATYMLKFANAYVYVDNQGYMLEVSENLLQVPFIIGISTETENIKEGNRLNSEDLQRLEDIIKIMEAAKNNKIESTITSIDISTLNNYIFELENEKKQVYFGNNLNINEKMLWVTFLIEKEKKAEGIIFVEDINKIFFREKV